MASKKYKLLFGLFTLLTSGAFAQVGGSYDVYDSSVIPSKRLPQQNEFWNNTYNFPAKPRNMWEIGASVGTGNIGGDVSTVVPGLGFEAHIRKAFGYVFSLRAQYVNFTAKGQNWRQARNYGKNKAWAGYNPATDNVFYNYKTAMQDLGLQGIVTLNNIRFHKNKTSLVMYAGGGVGATLYNTMVNARDAGGNTYTALFNSLDGSNYDNRKDILKALKDGMDDTYETEAENQGESRPKMGKNTLKPSGTVLGGIAIRLGKRVNLALEDRFTIVKDDLLDGQRWQEHPTGDAALTSDFDSYNFLSLGLNFNLGSKAVEPLWWLNPLDYAYDQLRKDRIARNNPKFDDADGDGVLDALDREPNTPADCPVDTHGVTKDTDGDGVPDCKDKQLITPTECQPVDADGIGKCPDPACCEDKRPIVDKDCACDYPSLSFKGNSTTLSSDAKAMLATVASKMKMGADCSITITGYPTTSKPSQAVCEKRLQAIKDYLEGSEGISSDRVSTNCEKDGGDNNTVDIKCN
ncbi:MAG: OmpA family protein [Chitinophagaceae bacterium]|nr:OmpA family protein [Chitinophagaceae bacterium]